MIDSEQRAAAAKFAEDWHERGNEKSDTQSFWLSLLAKVFGVRDVEAFIQFEKSVERLGHAGYIDAYIPSTKVLIEQKSLGIDLDKAFTQAKEYADNLPFCDKPRWIVVSDFATFRVHDMNHPLAAPEVIELKNLAKEAHRLKFLVDTGVNLVKREEEISLAAGRIIGELYDAFLKLYGDNPTEADLKNLNILCVRIVFCLYAEDAGILPKNAFYNYLNKFISSDIRVAMRDFFETLNTKPEARDRFLDPDLARLPYVNGGLFDGAVSIPPFSTAMRILLLEKASLNFDWSAISPTIFGAVFESTLNPDTRRKGGMHYTSVENIHKVIDPLFLEELWQEFREIIGEAHTKPRSHEENSRLRSVKPTAQGNEASGFVNEKFLTTKPEASSPCAVAFSNRTLRGFAASCEIDKKTRTRLLAFQQKLATLTFLDPACGSGNFLTETYLSLRRLENEVLRVLLAGQSELDLGDLVRVNIHQFYGIEINDFAVTVAKTALWIAESQMLKEAEDILHRSLDFLPLKTYSNIVEVNALTLDWETVVPRSRLSYIIGNPPFVGHQYRAPEQVADMDRVFTGFGNYGKLDYVACWYKKAIDYIQDAPVKCAFVSTNSLCQGESVATMWKPLFARGLTIDFAWHTFRWDSESIGKAHVHCVIVGFSIKETKPPASFGVENSHTKPRSHEEVSRLRSVKPTAQGNEASDQGNEASGFVKRGKVNPPLTKPEASSPCAVAFSNRNLRGFGASCEKTIFSADGRPHPATNINGYLLDAPDVFIENRGKPLTGGMPKMSKGSQPTDGGNLILSEAERDELLRDYPQLAPCIKQYFGAEDFINRKFRYCLWLKDANPELYALKPVRDRLARVRDLRLNSPTASVRRDAETPMLFTQIRQPSTTYLVVPEVSSERRRYIPIGFLEPDIIASNMVYLVPNATLYHFGVLTSSVHMAWMRTVCGRLENRYRYTPAVYNNFPWPQGNEASAQGNEASGFVKRGKGNPPLTKPEASSPCAVASSNRTLRGFVASCETISQTAQAILDARARYPDVSFKVLYDELTMPPDLRAAHTANDRAVLSAYGFDPDTAESEIVAELMKRYLALVSEEKR